MSACTKTRPAGIAFTMAGPGICSRLNTDDAAEGVDGADSLATGPERWRASALRVRHVGSLWPRRDLGPHASPKRKLLRTRGFSPIAVGPSSFGAAVRHGELHSKRSTPYSPSALRIFDHASRVILIIEAIRTVWILSLLLA